MRNCATSTPTCSALDLGDPQTLYEGGNFLMHTRHGDLDVFAVDQTAGAPTTFKDLRDRAMAIELLGLTLPIAHREDLIRMKTAAAQFRDRPGAKRRGNAVLEALVVDGGVDRGGADVGMAGELPDDADVHASVGEAGAERVAQHVR